MFGLDIYSRFRGAKLSRDLLSVTPEQFWHSNKQVKNLYHRLELHVLVRKTILRHK
jgi:hypothetical protein